jgi:signal transduction histidine kinase
VVLLPAAAQSGDAAPALAIRMPDGGVLTAQLPAHGEPPRLAGPLSFTLMFVVVSVTLLALWATRALRTPLSGFAKAAEGFSLDGDVAALPERGPEEIRAVAKAFNRMRDRIKKLVDDRTRLLAAMGHDLRTPITRLRLRSEFIGDEELRRQMLRDLDQMKAMTDGVLSFLRDGQTREAVTAIDIASVLQTVCDQYTDMGYAVFYEGPAHLTLAARPDDLQRAVANLVDNAVRHGASTVLRLAATAETAMIEVEDDGPGIPDERKDAMLEAFVRGEEARTMDDRSGFGLGLSIARTIAEAHGGTLTLHGRTPHGLIARITLQGAAP